MIKIGILGDIGVGKSHAAKLFGYPVFDADLEVARIYYSNRNFFKKIKKTLPKYFSSFPIKKNEIIQAILANSNNLKKITRLIHPEVTKKMNFFVRKNNKKNEKIVILDIPLLLENKLNKKKDILIFIQADKLETMKRLKKRKNFNLKLFKRFKNIQLSPNYKKKKSQFILKNNFSDKFLKKGVKNILKEII